MQSGKNARYIAKAGNSEKIEKQEKIQRDSGKRKNKETETMEERKREGDRLIHYLRMTQRKKNQQKQRMRKRRREKRGQTQIKEIKGKKNDRQEMR